MIEIAVRLRETASVRDLLCIIVSLLLVTVVAFGDELL